MEALSISVALFGRNCQRRSPAMRSDEEKDKEVEMETQCVYLNFPDTFKEEKGAGKYDESC